MNKISQSLPLVLFLFSTLFLLTDCRTDPKIEEEPAVEYKRTVNEVIVADVNEPDNLNPMLTTSSVSVNVLSNLFQTLQSVEPSSLTMSPLLVKGSPEVIEQGEGIAYTFELREDAVWPNGSPITAKDVAFSLKTILNPKVPSPVNILVSSTYSDFVMDADNPRKFTIGMKQKNIRSEELASSSFFIIPAYHYDAKNLLADISVQDLLNAQTAEQLANSNPNLQAFADEFLKPKYAREAGGVVGSGPYQLEEWVTGQRLTLTKKENWWGDVVEDNIYYGNDVDKVTFQPIKDENTAIAAMQNEEIDVMGGMAPEAFKTLKADETASKVYDFYTAPRYVTGFWYINHENPILEDRNVRRALAHLVDVDGIIETVLDMPLTRIATPVLPTMPGYDASLKPIPFNVEKAKELLAASGWKDSDNNGILDKEIEGELVELTLEVMVSNARATQEQAAQLVKEDAIEAGMNLEISIQDFQVQIQNLNNGNYDLSLGATLERTPWAYDPHQSWHTSSIPPNGANRTRFGNAETDALIEKIRTTMDEEKRKELYKEFQQIIYEEQPMVFLYEQPNFLAIHKRFNTKAFAYSPNYFIGDFDMNKK